MFGGLIDRLGKVIVLEQDKECLLLVVCVSDLWTEILEGQSIAVNGVCLTCVEVKQQTLSFQLTPSTCEMTNLSVLKINDTVNLERPLQMSSFIDGHLCSGHIDTIGIIQNIHLGEDIADVVIQYDSKHSASLVSKGSIAIDGVSLTVVSCEKGLFRVSLIPHTWKRTNFSERQASDQVNLEFDLLGKYVHSHLSLSKI